MTAREPATVPPARTAPSGNSAPPNTPAGQRRLTPTISVILPCLNEAHTVAACVIEANHGLRHLEAIGEIIVVDNGSTDNSAAIAAATGARVIIEPRPGYGNAIRAGITQARGDYVVIADADSSYDLTTLDVFLQPLLDGADLVIGNRFATDPVPGAMRFWNRRLGNPLLSALGRATTGSTIRDFHCGLRAARTDQLRALNLRATGMEYASEMIAAASQHGLRITQVPTRLRPDGRPGTSHLRPIRDGLRHLTLLLRLAHINRPRQLDGALAHRRSAAGGED